MSNWTYIRNGAIRDEQIGPVDTATLARRIERGEIKPDTLIASAEKTKSQWVQMRAFETLAVMYERGKDAREEEKRAAKQKKQKQRALGKRARSETAAAERRARRAAAPAPAILPPQEAAPVQNYAEPPAPVQRPAQVFAQQVQPGGSIVNVTVNAGQRERKSAGIAFLLSFLILGGGQLYQGRGAMFCLLWGAFGLNLLLGVPMLFLTIGVWGIVMILIALAIFAWNLIDAVVFNPR